MENPPYRYFNQYKDIETEEIFPIEDTEVLEFEKNNIILKSKIPISLIEPNMYIKNFNLIQKKYYKSLNYLPQDKAIKYIKTLNLLTSKRNKYK